MGHEKTLTGLIPALAGANLIYGPGMLESGIIFDFAQLVLDCEFVRMIKHTVRGFAILLNICVSTRSRNFSIATGWKSGKHRAQSTATSVLWKKPGIF